MKEKAISFINKQKLDYIEYYRLNYPRNNKLAMVSSILICTCILLSLLTFFVGPLLPFNPEIISYIFWTPIVLCMILVCVMEFLKPPKVYVEKSIESYEVEELITDIISSTQANVMYLICAYTFKEKNKEQAIINLLGKDIYIGKDKYSIVNQVFPSKEHLDYVYCKIEQYKIPIISFKAEKEIAMLNNLGTIIGGDINNSGELSIENNITDQSVIQLIDSCNEFTTMEKGFLKHVSEAPQDMTKEESKETLDILAKSSTTLKNFTELAIIAWNIFTGLM